MGGPDAVFINLAALAGPRQGWHFSPRSFAVKIHSVDDSQYGPCNQSHTPGSDNPRRVYGHRHQLMTASTALMTASMVHVTNLTHPGVPTLAKP
jgi:hypothetical protein